MNTNEIERIEAWRDLRPDEFPQLGDRFYDPRKGDWHIEELPPGFTKPAAWAGWGTNTWQRRVSAPASAGQQDGKSSRTRTLLRSMLSALNGNDYETFFKYYGLLNDVVIGMISKVAQPQKERTCMGQVNKKKYTFDSMGEQCIAKPRTAPSKAERSEQPQESFKPFFKDVEGKSDAYIESIISGRQEWTVETICMLSCQSIVDLHNAELATVREQGNFARVQEQARQLSELREAIMGGTGAKAVATHEQLLEKVVTEHQRLEAAESIAAHYKTELLSAQAALKELQDERAKDKDLPKV